MIMITHEEFDEIVNSIKNMYDNESKLEEILGVEGILTYSNGIIDYTIFLLEKIMQDEYEWIQYYIWELDFGKNWNETTASTADGEIIYLRNNKELYDFLLKDEGLK